MDTKRPPKAFSYNKENLKILKRLVVTSYENQDAAVAVTFYYFSYMCYHYIYIQHISLLEVQI